MSFEKKYLRGTIYPFWESVELRIKIRPTNFLHAEIERDKKQCVQFPLYLLRLEAEEFCFRKFESLEIT